MSPKLQKSAAVLGQSRVSGLARQEEAVTGHATPSPPEQQCPKSMVYGGGTRLTSLSRLL